MPMFLPSLWSKSSSGSYSFGRDSFLVLQAPFVAEIEIDRINWGRIPRDEAVSELKGKPEGTFLLRMSQTDNETYSLSVVQDGQVRHIRVIASDAGYCINKADEPCKSISALIEEKMGERIKSKLAGGETKETVLLQEPHYLPEEDSDDGLDMGALMGGSK